MQSHIQSQLPGIKKKTNSSKSEATTLKQIRDSHEGCLGDRREVKELKAF